MPDPASYSSEDEWMSSCVPAVMDEGKPQDAAVAQCSSMWRDRNKDFADALPPVDRAWSTLTVKSVDAEQMSIEGWATTPSVDRMGDIVESTGAAYDLPLPLLWQHRHDQPVGHIVSAKATKGGIWIKAQLAKVDQPGALRDRIDEAWQSVKAGLVRGLSIGFKPLEAEPLKNGNGYRFLRWAWLETSLVTIPAQAEATISVVKSIDQSLLAASGHGERQVDSRPGVAGKPVSNLPRRGTRAMAKQTTAEQISAFEATRAAKSARMEEIMAKAADDGETLAAEESEEYDGLETEVRSIDQHLKRLRALEASKRSAATPVNGASTEDASETRSGAVRVDVRHTLPKGTAFTRYVMAMAAARGAPLEALEYAKRWDPQTPEVSAYIRQTAFNTKAEPGTTTGPEGSPPAGWGSALVYQTNLAEEFVELLRPATVIGRMDGFRRVPFNVRIPVQTGGSTVNWVGEAAAKPVSELAFDTLTLTYSKIAGIVVLTDELVRLSSPSAEATVRQDLVRQVAQFMDEQFLDPAITETADRPASITNGVTGAAASGADADALYADLNTALAAFDTVDLGTGNLWIVTTPALARGISALRNPLGQFEFSSLNVAGGNLMGFPVVVSNSAPAGNVILIKTDEILLADDGAVTIDASNQATLDMAGGNSPTFSLWQKNCIGVRAERWVRYKKRRAQAVNRIHTATYGPV